MQSQDDDHTSDLAPLDRLSSSFGQQNVQPLEREERIHQLFQSIAGRYDLMNDLMSAGLHRLWKRQFVAHITPAISGPLYDIAGGGQGILRLCYRTDFPIFPSIC